jgi:ABC-type transporter Mla subunit MlaD
VQQLIDNLNTVVATISKDGDKFSGAVDKLNKLITGLSSDATRSARPSPLDNGTASLTDLLGEARQPLAGTIDQAPVGAEPRPTQGLLDITIKKAPKNYRKLVRLGSYGSFINSTCAACRSASPTCRAGPRTSPGSSNTPEGARSPDAEIPRFLAHQVGLPRRGADHSGHRRRPAAGEMLSMATNVRYQALFSEAGGIMPGNDVTVSGMVGTVQDVALRDGDALVTFLVKGAVELGSDTTAHIRTGTLLGERVLTLESAGNTTMKPQTLIPITRPRRRIR